MFIFLSFCPRLCVSPPSPPITSSPGPLLLLAAAETAAFTVLRQVSEIAGNPWAEVAWYLPETREQFRLAGRLTVVGDDHADEKLCKVRRMCRCLPVRAGVRVQREPRWGASAADLRSEGLKEEFGHLVACTLQNMSTLRTFNLLLASPSLHRLLSSLRSSSTCYNAGATARMAPAVRCWARAVHVATPWGPAAELQRRRQRQHRRRLGAVQPACSRRQRAGSVDVLLGGNGSGGGRPLAASQQPATALGAPGRVGGGGGQRRQRYRSCSLDGTRSQPVTHACNSGPGAMPCQFVT